jgi:phage shock protein E
MLLLTILIIAVVAGMFITTVLKKRKIGTMLNNTSEKPLIIDVRTKQEYNSGHYEGARNIPHNEIEVQIKKLEAWKNSPIIVYCHAGSRAGIAESILKSHGFSNVVNAGGYASMKQYAHQ